MTVRSLLIMFGVAFAMMSGPALATAADVQRTAEQAEALEFFGYFINRFADNAEPVDGQVVSNCIAFYDGMVNKGGASGLTGEQQFDLFGSLLGWQLLASNKYANASLMPESSLNQLIENQSEFADIEKLADLVQAKCQSVELRAHTTALEKEKVSK